MPSGYWIVRIGSSEWVKLPALSQRNRSAGTTECYTPQRRLLRCVDVLSVSTVCVSVCGCVSVCVSVSVCNYVCLLSAASFDSWLALIICGISYIYWFSWNSSIFLNFLNFLNCEIVTNMKLTSAVVAYEKLDQIRDTRRWNLLLLHLQRDCRRWRRSAVRRSYAAPPPPVPLRHRPVRARGSSRAIPFRKNPNRFVLSSFNSSTLIIINYQILKKN